MKLMKLLTVGRSFKGAKPALGQYKVQQSLLPKFSSSVRPSKAATARIAERLPKLHAALSEAPVVVSETKTPSEPSVAPVVAEKNRTQKIPAGTILKRVPQAEEKLSQPVKTSWLQKKFSGLKKRFFPPRSKKKAGAVPMQTEWALEKVTVARNDLSDADLEVVAPKTGSKISLRKPHLPDFGRVKNSSVEWVKMKTRKFRVTSPFQVSDSEKGSEPVSQRDEKEHALAERI